MIIWLFIDNDEMKAYEDFLNQMHVNKMEDKYFVDNMVIYIKK